MLTSPPFNLLSCDIAQLLTKEIVAIPQADVVVRGSTVINRTGNAISRRVAVVSRVLP